MSNDSKEVTTTQGGQQNLPANPFARAMAAHANAGTVEIESSRAVAEAQAAMIVAKRFPRDEARAYAKVMESCSRRGLAVAAQYSFPRGTQTASGPTIRLAEELARSWCNLDYGIRELSRRDGVSEMQAYCIDLETNVKSAQNFTVRHIRDKKSGGQALTDERDIYELTANMGARRLRARILAILPPDLVAAAEDQCRKTLAGQSDEPLADRVKKMTAAFGKLGVQADAIERRLGHPLKDTTIDELVELIGIYNSLKDGMTRTSEWFGAGAEEPSDAKNVMTAAANGGGQAGQAPAKQAAKPPKATKSKTKTKAAAPAPEPEPPAEAEEAETADTATAENPPAGDDDDVF